MDFAGHNMRVYRRRTCPLAQHRFTAPDLQKRASEGAPVREQPLPTGAPMPHADGRSKLLARVVKRFSDDNGRGPPRPYKIWQQSRLDLQMSLPQH